MLVFAVQLVRAKLVHEENEDWYQFSHDMKHQKEDAPPDVHIAPVVFEVVHVVIAYQGLQAVETCSEEIADAEG